MAKLSKKPTTERKKKAKIDRSASLENPAIPLSAASIDDDIFGASGRTGSNTGVRVTEKRVLGYHAVWRGVNLISTDVGKLPLGTYRRVGTNREPVPEHSTWWLLRHEPNPSTCPLVWLQTMQASALIRGNGYSYIDRDKLGVPTGMYIIDPDKIAPIRVGGETWYVYAPDGDWSNPAKLPAADVVHIRGLGGDSLQGHDVLSVLRDTFGGAIARRDHAGAYFRNGARPGGVLSFPKVLSKQAEDRQRENWARLHEGLNNSHKVAILQEGVTYTPFPGSARDAQMQEARAYDVIEISNVLGVPPHKLGDSSKVAYNSLGQENQAYYDGTLLGWLVLWSQELTRKLLTRDERRAGYEVGHDFNQLMLANVEAKVSYATAAISGGWASVDEVRAMFGLNPIPGARGNEYGKPAPSTSKRRKR